MPMFLGDSTYPKGVKSLNYPAQLREGCVFVVVFLSYEWEKTCVIMI